MILALRLRGELLPLVVRAAVVLGALLRADARAVDDLEPNDTPATAVDTGLVNVGTVTVAAGTVESDPLATGDRDLYRFVVTDGPVLPIRLSVQMIGTTDGFDGFIRLFDADGVELSRADDVAYPLLDPELGTFLLAPGDYYVGVSHALNPHYDPTDGQSGRWAGNGGYSLAITLSEVPPLSSSLEPVIEGPINVTALPFTATGQFIGDGQNELLDVDRYTLTITQPSIVRTVVTPSEPGGFDPLVTIEVAGTSVGEHRVPRADAVERFVEAAVLTAGTATVVVKGTRSAPNPPDSRYGWVGFYDLGIEVTPVVSLGNDAYEPDDSLLTANPIDLVNDLQMSIDGAYVGNGEFGAFRGDVDFYEASLRVGQRWEVQVSPTDAVGALQPVVELYTDLGVRLDRWYADASGDVRGAFEVRCGGPSTVFNEVEPTIRRYAVAVMGEGDRPTNDPLNPNPSLGPHGAPNGSVPRLPLHLLDGGPGSTGGYDVRFTSAASGLPTCGEEPNDAIGELGDPVLIDEGVYICVNGRLSDGPCPSPQDNVDLIPVYAGQAPATMEIKLIVAACGDQRSLRLFGAAGNQVAASFPFNAAEDPFIHYSLTNPGAYYVGVSARENYSYDPHTICSKNGFFTSDPDYYELEIRLTPTTTTSDVPASASAGASSDISAVFATRPEPLSPVIDRLDPLSGASLVAFEPPEAPMGGNEGLAFDGQMLFSMGRSGRYPYLYELDAGTGAVVGRALLWFGSGIYGQTVFHAGSLFVVDVLERAIYVTPPDLSGVTRRLDLGAQGISARGAIAVALGPERLVVTDAANPGLLHHLHPMTGVLQSSQSLSDVCPCDGDLDSDADVDAEDRAFFEACASLSGVTFGCESADLNCDGVIDGDDLAILECLRNAGSIEDCCPLGLPSVAIRATSLAAIGPGVLLAGDWTEPVLHRFSPTGLSLGSVFLDAPVGALTSVVSAAFADADLNGQIDLIDWSHLQRCFTGSDAGPYGAGCVVFDADVDDDVDSLDYAMFQEAVTGAVP